MENNVPQKKLKRRFLRQRLDDPTTRFLNRQLLEYQDSLEHRQIKTPEKLRRLKGITTVKRSYKSVDWIEIIIDSELTGKGIDAKIKANLSNKKPLLDILRCLISDAMIYHEAERFARMQGIGKVKMQAKIREFNPNAETGKAWKQFSVERDRVQIIVKVNFASIAARLNVSVILVKKYLSAMERVGLIQRPANIKKGNPVFGACRIIGGYVVYQPPEDDPKGPKGRIASPVYFWSRTQPKIKSILADFGPIFIKSALYT